jgi:hypothetical protein
VPSYTRSQYIANFLDGINLYTSSPKEFVCALMEMENSSVYISKRILELCILIESLFITVESWHSGANIGVR